MKVKIGGIRPEVDKLIKDLAEKLQLYDPKFSENEQCSGYFAFKEACLMSEDTCTYDEFLKHFHNQKYHNHSPSGYYLLNRIHPNLRQIFITAVKGVRLRIKTGKAKDQKDEN